MSQTILVVGGAGMLGAPVARRLCAAGHHVRIFTRNPAAAATRFGADYAVVGGDVEDRTTVAAALRGCQGVHINLDGGLDPDLERRGVENVAQTAAAAGVQRLTYLSGAAATAENAWYAGAKAKVAAEAAIRRAGVPYTIFKATFFMEALPKFVRGERASIIGSQPTPWHWVAADDYARMVVAAYATPAAADKTLAVYGPAATTMPQA